jgi:uncharacterized membrane protein YhaH (DUF805 family)
MGLSLKEDTMTLGQSIQTVFRKYADFTGRADRAEFWWWVLFTVLVSAALNSTLWFAGGNPWNGSPFLPGPSLGALWAVAVLVPSLAVTVRRLRDAGHDWAHIFWLLLPVAGTIVLIVLCAQPSKAEPVAAGAPDAQTRPVGTAG